MKVPAVEGIIERRLLVNYRIAPGALAGLLPAPFRPKLVGGYAIAGICLIRLASVRPRGLPAGLGLRSENAAHRIVVEWDADGRSHDGVYIPRRDSDSVCRRRGVPSLDVFRDSQLLDALRGRPF